MKETTGAFDGVQTHDWQASSNYASDELLNSSTYYEFIY